MNGARSRSEQQGQHEDTARLAQLGRISGQLFHDLVGATSLLRGTAELVRDEMRRGHTAGPEVEDLCEHAMHLERMVADVFEEVRGSKAGAEVRFEADEVVRSAVERWMTAALPRSLDLRQETSVSGEICGRASFLMRAIQNLLNNAARHARRRVEVRMARDAGNARDWIVIDVEDDGPGVPWEEQPFLFETFRHGGHGGTGLGLSYVRWAVNRLGGEVDYRDGTRLGGACFRIRAPVAPPLGGVPSGKARRRPSLRSDALAGVSIVVVDDDESLLTFYRKLFTRSGARVTALRAFGDERDDALAELAVEASPDVVLLDRRLGRISGEDVCREILHRDPTLLGHISFLTGGGDTFGAGQPSSAVPVLDKMMDVRELVSEVARLGG